MADLRIDAGWVLTPTGALRDASVVVDLGAITWVGPTTEAPNAHTIERTTGVLAPGMVDAHTHLGLSFARALGPTSGHPVYDVFWPLEGALTPDLVEAFSAASAAESLLSGTTCVADHYFFAEASAAATTRLGLRSVLGETIVVTDAPHSGPRSLGRAIEVAERLAAIDLVHPALAPHALDTVGDDAMVDIVAESVRLDVPIHLHVSQSEREVATIAARTAASPVQRLADLGVFDRRVIAAHCMYATDADLHILAASPTTTAIYCPTVHAHLGRSLRAAEMIAAGGLVGIGTDAVPNERRDVNAEVRAASAHQAVLTSNGDALPRPDAWLLATQGSATAVGLGGVVGAIEVGRRADLVVHSIDGLPAAPFTDPLALAIMSGPDMIISVWVDGRQVVADGHLVGDDEQRIVARAAEARIELFERAGRTR